MPKYLNPENVYKQENLDVREIFSNDLQRFKVKEAANKKTFNLKVIFKFLILQYYQEKLMYFRAGCCFGMTWCRRQI